VLFGKCLLQVLVHSFHDFGEQLPIEKSRSDRVVL